MKPSNTIESILKSRAVLRPNNFDYHLKAREEAAEGGCGVIGMACSEKIAGKHLLQALDQMRNRGNGKGGGIAAVGLNPNEWGVSQEVLDNDYLLVHAYLDATCRKEIEEEFVSPLFEIDHIREQPHIQDYRTLKSLDVPPPEVVEYFVRIKDSVRNEFSSKYNLTDLPQRKQEDEIVYQNSYLLNSKYYASTGETKAFVLSHGKNLLVLKMVGYGDDVIRYYELDNLHAHVWIGHHRYPTKGRVWHPGGAHPFIGMNEALVHNGDFANYASICEHLAQRNIYPLFLTDTEVSVQVFDLLRRTYDYPLEYVIESLAPTTERDFSLLPPEKQRVYHMLQTTHMHSSPDGPWFFLIAQSEEEKKKPVYRLTCITDTSMLRPQVFAWQENNPEGLAIGFAASEKQAIDAALASLAETDSRFWSRADRYWNARGGSHTDGGAFIFSVKTINTENEDSITRLMCTDKFGNKISFMTAQPPYSGHDIHPIPTIQFPSTQNATHLIDWMRHNLLSWTYTEVLGALQCLEKFTETVEKRALAIETLTGLMDQRYPTRNLRRSSLLALYDKSLSKMLRNICLDPDVNFAYTSKEHLTPKSALPGQTIIIDARGFDPEGSDSLAMGINHLYQIGFRKFIIANIRGHRFIGNGLGSDNMGVKIDVYGSPGDYLGSGIDGMEIHVHGNAQDQLAQIMKRGKLVVFGDVGQTFMYGAKGGEAYVLGNAAGRPLINAVGKPRVVINGTCLDYLAESFMAGDPHNGGGFVILNGITLTDHGEIIELETPYPGGNLFSLASGGAIYVRDPHRHVSREQLNGGEFLPFTQKDWNLIRPYLEENFKLFGIPVEKLLEVNGHKSLPTSVYRKIGPVKVRALQAEEAWVQFH